MELPHGKFVPAEIIAIDNMGSVVQVCIAIEVVWNHGRNQLPKMLVTSARDLTQTSDPHMLVKQFSEDL